MFQQRESLILDFASDLHFLKPEFRLTYSYLVVSLSFHLYWSLSVDDATSDAALFLLLGAIRRFPLALASLETTFNSSFPFTTASDPRGKTLGLIGLGGIGGAFAKKASAALGMKIIYHNRNQLSAEKEREHGNATYKKTIEEVLKESDVVSLHCPLNEKTKGLIGKKELEMMKKTSILINTSRGPVVKEAELAEALENDVIAGCGLDVYESEVSSLNVFGKKQGSFQT